MFYIGFGLTLSLIFLNWTAVWFGWRLLNYVSKAFVIIALLIWLMTSVPGGCNTYLFLAGLIFSLVGDILLLLSSRYFLFGLIAFLMTHLCYTAGFLIPLPQFSMAVLLLVFLNFSIWFFTYAQVKRWVSTSSAFHRLNKPLICYSLAVWSMVTAALLTVTRTDWIPQSSGLVISGALLFLFSDLLLAYDRFKQSFGDARLWKRVSYHLGQLAIIAGVLLQFNR